MLAGIGGELSKSVESRISDTMFKSGWAQPDLVGQQPAEVSAKAIQIVMADNQLEAIARLVLKNQQNEGYVDMTEAAELLEVAPNGRKYLVKQIDREFPAELKLLNVRDFNGRIDIVFARNTSNEVNLYRTLEDGKLIRAVQKTRQGTVKISPENKVLFEAAEKRLELEKAYWIRELQNTAVSALPADFTVAHR